MSRMSQPPTRPRLVGSISSVLRGARMRPTSRSLAGCEPPTLLLFVAAGCRHRHHHAAGRNVDLGDSRLGEGDQLGPSRAGEADLQEVAGAVVLYRHDL